MTLSGSPFDYLIAFVGGIIFSFTPCVYPLIPVTAGFVIAETNGSKFRGFSLSLIYVTGIAITYSLLGLIASLTGGFFGRISSHPFTHIFVGMIMIFFGISLLEVFMINVPNFVKLPDVQKKNHLSALVLGLVSGLIVGPCLTPVLGAILLYITTKENILYGMTLLFCFAYGMGFLLILVGTFGGVLARFPKAGKWMIYVKKVSAFVVIATGIYFIFNGIRRI